jgi:hypothetical protein
MFPPVLIVHWKQKKISFFGGGVEFSNVYVKNRRIFKGNWQPLMLFDDGLF